MDLRKHAAIIRADEHYPPELKTFNISHINMIVAAKIFEIDTL